MMSNVRKVLLTYKNEKTIKKQRYMETSIQNVPGRCFDEVQLFRFIPSGVSVSVWRSNSSLRFFSTLGHSHGFSLSLSPPGLLQSGRTGRSGLQQACPASSFRCLSNVCPSKCGECSLFPLHTVAHISCKKSDRLNFGLACYWTSDVVLSSGVFVLEGVACLDLSTVFAPMAVARGVSYLGGRGWSGYPGVDEQISQIAWLSERY